MGTDVFGVGKSNATNAMRWLVMIVSVWCLEMDGQCWLHGIEWMVQCWSLLDGFIVWMVTDILVVAELDFNTFAVADVKDVRFLRC